MDPRILNETKNALEDARRYAREMGAYIDELPQGTQAASQRKSRLAMKANHIVESTTIALNLPDYAPEQRVTELGPRAREVFAELRERASEALTRYKSAVNFATIEAFQNIVDDVGTAAEYSWAVHRLKDYETAIERGTWWCETTPFGWREALKHCESELMQWYAPSSSNPWYNANRLTKFDGLKLLRETLVRAITLYEWEVERTRQTLAKQIADGVAQITPALDATPSAG